MLSITFTCLALLSFRLALALNTDCAPGGNFDLTGWNLQLSTGDPGKPDTIPGSQLAGCKGYQDKSTFYTDSKDGALVMKVIGSPASTGCVTTKNSKHCRTELREIKPSSWDPNAKTNRLNATIQVTKADDSNYGTVIGQIHIDDSISTKPVCELYYNKAGVITMGVEKTRAGGSSIYTQVGNVPVGTKFDYAIIYEKNVLGVTINGGKLKTLSTNELDAPKSYFKVGNYNQGDSASEVRFYAIETKH
ncbi:Concanavalin A-like lectins/glucanase [Glarea lozoyensis ATCC 20868]|uniref:Concanavalin A-like lectins/glucanase n=1 Tax=Glarea lozoyensis (strain ATCC 20868 / MF5171) TaxID=1116229 RepID=S3DSQ4_GLAL2|nr:Concanavalin A-like lectins/glucanase [Glarea lozoyensis ATCC 20868]EPE35001.1 Concanavalin A-like lectins/glucanase [Glarea lozoyensis ATCC 20868]